MANICDIFFPMHISRYFILFCCYVFICSNILEFDDFDGFGVRVSSWPKKERSAVAIRKSVPAMRRYAKLRSQCSSHRIHVCYIWIYIYMVTFTINIPQMLAYIPYMDPMQLGSEDIRMALPGRALKWPVPERNS